ncbi:MAG: hypothetical protein II949_07880 [Prevotella sp.]|nr:hypothetical protein [Prevotella sp.]
MRKSRKKWGCALTVIAVVFAAGIFGLYWGWKYYGLPEWPDRREYKTIEERADKALAFARRHNLNEHYALFWTIAYHRARPGCSSGTSIRRR